MIKVEYLGRTGNNLFQYALGRILATKLGHKLVSDPIPGFPGTYESIDGRNSTAEAKHHTGHLFPLNEVIEERGHQSHVLRGYFQRAEYFLPYREEILSWLRFSDEFIASMPSDFLSQRQSAVIMNIRRTDYTQNGWALPSDYYHSALAKCELSQGELWIITEDPKDPFFAHFHEYKPRFLNVDPVSQMAAMSQASTLIMSASTFSWWGAFFGKTKRVFCPNPSYGVWSTNERATGSDLLTGMDFEFIDCNHPYVATRNEAAYQNVRVLKRKWILRANRWLGLQLEVPLQ